MKHFKQTLLCISDDVSGPGNRSGAYPLLDYARERGVTLRDDSILVQPHPEENALRRVVKALHGK